MSIQDALRPKPLDDCSDIAEGGEYSAKLSLRESCLVLKVHGYGVDCLSQEEKDLLHSIFAKSKDEIWP